MDRKVLISLDLSEILTPSICCSTSADCFLKPLVHFEATEKEAAETPTIDVLQCWNTQEHASRSSRATPVSHNPAGGSPWPKLQGSGTWTPLRRSLSMVRIVSTRDRPRRSSFQPNRTWSSRKKARAASNSGRRVSALPVFFLEYKFAPGFSEGVAFTGRGSGRGLKRASRCSCLVDPFRPARGTWHR